MNIGQALENIKFLKNNKFMLDEIKCIRENKAEAIPVLLEYIKYAGENAEELDNDYMGHIYAIFLLAEFDVRDAFEPIIEYLELPGETSDDILGDSLTDDIPRILGKLAVPEDIVRLKSIIESKALDYSNRTAALQTLIVMYVNEKYSYDELAEYFADLIQNCVDDENEDYDFCAWLSCYSLDIYAEKSFSNIELLLERDRIDEFIVGDREEFLKQVKSENKEDAIKKIKDDKFYNYISDAIEAMQWWACFKEETKKTTSKLVSYTGLANGAKQAKSNKIGRNEPCPCGSGKKYKKCCGR